MKRVVVTGLGVISPLGNTVDEFSDNLLNGKSGIKTIDIFAPGNLPSKIAGQCTLDNYQFKDRKIDFALSAASSAIEDASNDQNIFDYYSNDKTALSIGIGLELFDMHDMIQHVNNDYTKPDNENRIDYLQTPGDLCIELLMNENKFTMPPSVHISACAAGTDAIGQAFLKIRRGEAKAVLTGGTDSMINPLGLGGFCKLNALSTKNDNPEKASRPFDVDRDGFVLGEGSGMLVLEEYESAKKRSARIYAELTGYGNTFDAYSVSEPHPEGDGAYRSMSKAVRMSQIRPDQISYINAHGTSTPKNDPVETLAIKKLFGDNACKIPISSTKSMIGHLISAAGAVEAVASIACAQRGMVSPTINLDNPDPACDLDYVPHKSREVKVNYFLSNSFAFGGMNSSLVFRNWSDNA